MRILEILLDPSFLGALIGAIITGIIAIVVFAISNNKEISKRKRMIATYYNIIKEVHKSAFPTFQMFLDVVNRELELPEDYQLKLVELDTQQRILDLINIEEMIKESNEAYNVLNYIVIFRAIFTIIDSPFGTLGRNWNEIDKIISNSNFNELGSNITQLEKIISSI